MEIETIQARLKECGCEEAYLTGSRAKGLARKNSDIDLLIFLNREMCISKIRKAFRSERPEPFIDIHFDITLSKKRLDYLVSWATRIV